MIDKVNVKGKSELVTVYEIFDADNEQNREGKLATKDIFANAFSFYEQKDYAKAAQLFNSCLEKNPLDTVAQSYLKRCQ
jgi:TolA-binding protein